MCTATHPDVRTYRELRQEGWSRGDVERALESGLWVRARRGVYAAASACDSARTAAEHGGPLACVSAARHLGMWVMPDDATHVWMRAGGHRRHDDAGCGCVEHWDGAERWPSFAIPAVCRVLSQILSCQGVEGFFVALESGLRLGLVGPAALAWLRATVGAAGCEALDLARTDADSGLESLLRWRLRALGLRIRTQQRLTAVGVVDILIGDRLVIEADGRANHDAPPLRHKDLVRDANAAAWGYVTLRFDYALIVHDWDLVERAILGQLDAAARR